MMVGAAVAAPIAEGAGLLLVVLSWAVAFGLLYVYRSTIGRVVLAIADQIDGVGISTRFGSIHPLDPLADVLRWADGQIRDGLGIAVANTERAASWLFHTLTAQLRALGDAVGGLAYDVSHALDRTVTQTIPNAVGRAERRSAQALSRTRAIAVATAATVAHELPGLRREVANWRGLTRRLARRLRRVERLLAPAAFAALVVGALTRLGLGVLRCPRFLKAARRTCGMDPALLESMLLDTTLILGAISLVEFAHELQAVVEPVESGIRHLIREA